MIGIQTLIYLAPIIALRDQIEGLASGGQGIGFPIPDAKNPVDLASVDPDFHLKNVALSEQDWGKFQRLMEGLRKRYPKSPLIRWDLAKMAYLSGEGTLTQEFDIDNYLKTLVPDPADTVAEQASCLSAKAFVLLNQKQFNEASKVLETAIALSPKDYFQDRRISAQLLLRTGKFAESEKLLNELWLDNPDDCSILMALGYALEEQGKLDQIPELKKRERNLIQIYRAR